MKIQLNKTLALAAALLAGLGCQGLFAQGTAFTYQGLLSQNGAAATGPHDFEFRLFTAATNGAQAGGTVSLNDVGVTNGLFTVVLDFGSVFDGRDLFLEIAVRPGADSGPFTPLLPRRPLTAAPYAVRAATAATAAAVPPGTITGAMLAPGAVTALGSPDGTPVNALQVSTNGFVGIGTNAPAAGLQIVVGSQILSPQMLYQVLDGQGAFTNLAGAWHVAVSGNLAAIAGMNDNAVTLVSLDNSTSPSIHYQFKHGEGAYTNMINPSACLFAGNILAVFGSESSCVTLIDVLDPANPFKRAELKDGVGGFNELLGAWNGAVSGTLLAIAGRGDNAVTLVDISNPANPQMLSVILGGAGNYTNFSGPQAVAILGNLLAIAHWEGVTLVDISTPAAPVFRKFLGRGVAGWEHLRFAAEVHLSGNLLTVTSGQYDGTISLVDASNPASPVLLSVLRTDSTGLGQLHNPGSIARSGNCLAVAAGGGADSEIALYDAQNPAQPLLQGSIRNTRSGCYNLNGRLGLAFHTTNLLVTASESASFSIIHPATNQVSLASAGWVGIGTTRPAAALQVVGDLMVTDGNDIELRARHVNLGNYTIASGENSTAMGYSTTASGPYSTAMGYRTTASGIYSTAMGNYTTASDYSSTAMGNYTTASGIYSTAMGNYTTASSASSTAMGDHATASGYNSTAMGSGTTASGYNSTTMGVGTRASGDSSTAMGSGTTASANSSTAMGFYTTASGYSSTAMGYQTTATNYAFAAGYRSKAIHDGSFVWADPTEADFSSSGFNQFLIRASGGVGINTTNTGGAALTVNGAAVAGSFAGAGGGLTGLNASQLTSGTLPDARLSASVAIRGGGNAFSGTQTIMPGTLGIGTTSPQTPLHVYSANSLTTLRLQSAAAPGAGRIEFMSDPQGSASEWRPAYIQSTDNGGFMGGLAFVVNGAGFDNRLGQVETMRVVNGRVGIGTTTPSTPLHVVGTVTATTFSPTSDRHAKENFAPVSPAEVLAKVAALPISRWNFKGEAAAAHVGPMAQDFKAAFGLGTDDKHIATVDADGVALAAIQGLNQKVETGKRRAELEMAELKAENAELRQELAAIKAILVKLGQVKE